ncbi:MAG: DUF1700 domain-containing protein [Lachnospiraceae bacterium]|nr:DUF1700 domain-containing protein [Lachnospiraceae bacterium]
MTKFEFLGDLSRLIADLPEEDREQAMEYYEDYFADAGPEKEQEIIHDFVSPEYVAAQIRESSLKKQSGKASKNIDVGLLSALANDAQQQGVDASVFETTNTGNAEAKPTTRAQAQAQAQAQGQAPQMKAQSQAQAQALQQMKQTGSIPRVAPGATQAQAQAAQAQAQAAARAQAQAQAAARAQAQPGQAAQVNNLRRANQSGGITIDDSELGDMVNLDGKIVNPWEAKGDTEKKDSKQVEQEKAREELRKETRDSEFLRANKSGGIQDLYEEASESFEIDPKKKTMLNILLVVTCPITILAILLIVAAFIGSIALTILSAGGVVASFGGTLASLYVVLISLSISKLPSALFFLGIAFLLLAIGISLIFFVIFMVKVGISGFYFSILSWFSKAKLAMRNFTIKK